MKNLYLLFILFNLQLFSQKNIVKYVASTNPIFEISEDTSVKIPYSLIFNSENSFFSIDPNDSHNKYEMLDILAGDGIYYTDKDKCVWQNKFPAFFNDEYIIEMNKQQWTITNESRIIHGYPCKKATSVYKFNVQGEKKERKIEAWFTDKIKVSFGPKNYNGLPGLILVVGDGKVYFSASEIELNIDEKFINEEPKRGEKITEEEYEKKCSQLLFILGN